MNILSVICCRVALSISHGFSLQLPWTPDASSLPYLIIKVRLLTCNINFIENLCLGIVPHTDDRHQFYSYRKKTFIFSCNESSLGVASTRVTVPLYNYELK